MRYQTRLVLSGMLAVGVAFVVVIGGGFLIHDRYPDVPDELFAVIAVAILAAISFGLLWLLMGGRFGPGARRPVDPGLKQRLKLRKEESEREYAAFREHRRLRLIALRADPSKLKYAELVERGEEWSDEQIAYHEDVNATATCPHLQTVEHAMRLAGVEPKLIEQPWLEHPGTLCVKADCCINLPELKSRFTLADPVRYEEDYMPERSARDNPWAKLSCSEHGSAIDLVHSEWPRAKTKWFPSKP